MMEEPDFSWSRARYRARTLAKLYAENTTADYEEVSMGMAEFLADDVVREHYGSPGARPALHRSVVDKITQAVRNSIYDAPAGAHVATSVRVAHRDGYGGIYFNGLVVRLQKTPEATCEEYERLCRERRQALGLEGAAENGAPQEADAHD